MISLVNDANDSAALVVKITALINGGLAVCGAKKAYVLKLEHWFGKRWLGFSHKTCGALGVHKNDLNLRLPPFVPTRILNQQYFLYSEGKWERVAKRMFSIHRWQSSSENAHRKLTKDFPDTALFWWAGGSSQTSSGALMAYVPVEPEGHFAWYAGFKKKDGWNLVDNVGAGASELKQYERVGAGLVDAGSMKRGNAGSPPNN